VAVRELTETQLHRFREQLEAAGQALEGRQKKLEKVICDDSGQITTLLARCGLVWRSA
jgi:hypothetical protein